MSPPDRSGRPSARSRSRSPCAERGISADDGSTIADHVDEVYRAAEESGLMPRWFRASRHPRFRPAFCVSPGLWALGDELQSSLLPELRGQYTWCSDDPA
eukprot:7429421-Pyramimonas_sp.AAC.1